MKFTALKLSVILLLAAFVSIHPAATPGVDTVGAAPAFESIGPLSFGANDVLFAADNQAASIYALDLGTASTGSTPGTKSIAGLDRQVAALLGADVRDISVTDLAVHPKTGNAFISVMRGQGAGARPVLLRVDGAGAIQIVDLARLHSTKVTLPNAPSANAQGQAPSRAESVTDMAYTDGRLYIAGLSNEEFSSKLRSVSYPFATLDNGTSVEIYHGSHGQFETRSPVYTFLPYQIGSTPYLIASYLCTPLVKFPVASLQPGAKVMGTTIAELGNRNRPLDMILYKKDGKEFLLMSNNSRGVMKIPTERFAAAPGITTPVPDSEETRGISYETIASMKGTERLDLLDDTHSLALVRSSAGALNLESMPLP